ncbi:MAG: FAD-binding oxidoreductase [Acidimicrobiales bacterium]
MTSNRSRGGPTPPIAIAGGSAIAKPHLHGARVEVGDAFIERLRAACPMLSTEAAALAEASRDWWPLAMTWATLGEVASLAHVVATPANAEEVASVVAICNEARIPVTAAGGRSGVCGASIPVHGGVVLDLTALSGITSVDGDAMTLDVKAGTFGNVLEDELRSAHGKTIGHWPQSMDLSTVGGWLACRGAGQFSNRYGKIEDIVIGLDVVLADGERIATGGQPRQAVGPDLTQIFVGSEGTLGVITGARLKLHDAPQHTASAAYGFTSITDALDFQRKVLRRGIAPAVLRLYDPTEADRSYSTGPSTFLVLVHDEGDAVVVGASMAIVAEEAGAAKAVEHDSAHVATWLAHRNDVSALEALITKGYVVDTMEVAAPWPKLPAIYERTVEALRGVPGTIAASAHASHAYLDGACLYFTFAGMVEPDERDSYYRALWDAGQRSVLEGGGALSHHHGIGLNRSRFVRDALGPSFVVLAAVKSALDPNGILNPGKLGLPSPFGDVGF